MSIQVQEITRPDDKANQRHVNDWVKQMRANGAEAHPVLQEMGLYVFWGARVWVLGDAQGNPLSIHATKIGKRKKNIWEPAANWYAAYTLPAHRRRGHAYRLYAEMEREAVMAGCRHVKSLAGSAAGLGLHLSLRHKCWGQVPTGEVFVYSPLPGFEHIYPKGATPPQAPCPEPLSQSNIRDLIKKGLRYDHAN